MGTEQKNKKTSFRVARLEEHMEILIRKNNHKIHDLDRKYGCECPNCGTVFSCTKSESMYIGNQSGKQDFYIIRCPNCNKIINITKCTWLNSPQDVVRFLELHK